MICNDLKTIKIKSKGRKNKDRREEKNKEKRRRDRRHKSWGKEKKNDRKSKSPCQNEVIEQITYDVENQVFCNSAGCDRKGTRPCIKVLLKGYYHFLMNDSIWRQIIKQNQRPRQVFQLSQFPAKMCPSQRRGF